MTVDPLVGAAVTFFLAAIGFSKLYGAYTARFDAHEKQDDVRFEEQKEMLKEMRIDIKTILGHRRVGD